MALQKVDYVNQVTVITAENMNAIQDAIIALETAPAQGLTEDVKQALLQLAQKVAYIDDQGQTYYDDLYDALYPPKTVVLITAVFEQGSTVIYDDTALDDLKQYLTVTAKYDDNTTAILPDGAYTLTGLLEAGTSTVTVAYNGLTTTFTVNVTARPTLSSITATYTQSGTVYDTDTLDSLKADLVVTAVYSDSSTQTVPSADYTLSGTLAEGTSTITVSYGGETTTFNVTVSENSALYPLNSGTHTFASSGRKITVSDGNHFLFERTDEGKTSSFVNLTDISANDSTGAGQNNINNKPTWHTIPAGAEAVFEVKNITAIQRVTGGEFNVGVRGTGTESILTFSNNIAESSSIADLSVSKTFDTATDIGCIFFYGNKYTGTVSADIYLYVNGERWV